FHLRLVRNQRTAKLQKNRFHTLFFPRSTLCVECVPRRSAPSAGRRASPPAFPRGPWEREDLTTLVPRSAWNALRAVSGTQSVPTCIPTGTVGTRRSHHSRSTLCVECLPGRSAPNVRG